MKICVIVFNEALFYLDVQLGHLTKQLGSLMYACVCVAAVCGCACWTSFGTYSFVEMTTANAVSVSLLVHNYYTNIV